MNISLGDMVVCPRCKKPHAAIRQIGPRKDVFLVIECDDKMFVAGVSGVLSPGMKLATQQNKEVAQ